jgi:sRNA-binding carbon storage regulator CsrA
MVVLSCCTGDKVVFPELDLTLYVVTIRPGVVRIGIECPRDVAMVFREEDLQEIVLPLRCAPCNKAAA